MVDDTMYHDTRIDQTVCPMALDELYKKMISPGGSWHTSNGHVSEEKDRGESDASEQRRRQNQRNHLLWMKSHPSEEAHIRVEMIVNDIYFVPGCNFWLQKAWSSQYSLQQGAPPGQSLLRER